MNGKNLNVRYRKNTYAKTRIKVVLAMLGIGLAVLLVLFLVVGGWLNKKLKGDDGNTVIHGSQNTNDVVERKEVSSVRGYGVTLSGATATVISEKASEIARVGGNNISFVVRDAAGNEIYNSTLAQSMGKQTAGSYIDIGDIENRATGRGLSSSAIVPVYSFGKQNDIERAAQLFYDAAICVESSREGADDVLIKLEGTEITDENIDEVLRIAEWVKDLDENVVLGITLTRDFLCKEGVETLVGRLWEKYDFLSLDLTGMQSGESVSQDGSNNEIQFYLLMYKMRVLLPDLPAEELQGIIAELGSMNVDNWQTVVK